MCFSAQRRREISMDCCGDPSNDENVIEVLRRAIVEGEQDARLCLQQSLGDVVCEWLRQHPRREIAYYLGNEEYYIAATFERFWQLAFDRQLEFSTFDSVMPYLRLSLNGAILDTLRTYSRPREVALPEPGEAGEPPVEDQTDSKEIWKILHTILPSDREKRLAYLLYHCGLGPREIVHFCPQEWNDVQDIYRLRVNIMERLLCNADPWRWRLR
jgi:hypothetical protein